MAIRSHTIPIPSIVRHYAIKQVGGCRYHALGFTLGLDNIYAYFECSPGSGWDSPDVDIDGR